MKLKVSVTIPIKLISIANNHVHWRRQYEESKKRREPVVASLNRFKGKIPLPCSVILTRFGTRKLDDDDNLRMAFKGIKDDVADIIIPGLAKGRADGDLRITWHYKQETAKLSGFRIDIYECFPVPQVDMPHEEREHIPQDLQQPAD